MAAQELKGDALKSAASRLEEQAFRLLNWLNSRTGPDGPGPLLGPVASLAADAQSLGKTLEAGDRGGAGRAMAALKSDREAVESGLAAHPAALEKPDWEALKAQLDLLAKAIPAAPRALPAAAPPAPIASAPSVEAGGVSAAPADDSAYGLKAKIESATVEDNDIVRLKGFVEGSGLKSAGIYDGERVLRPFEVGRTTGAQRINFDIELERVTPGMKVRVYDRAGHLAEAAIIAGGGVKRQPPVAARPKRPASPNIALGGDVGVESEETELATPGGGSAESRGSTAEIPSRASPSRRLPGAARPQKHFGDINIYITGVTLLDPMLRQYQVRGQISGSTMRKAGIYVDGNEVEEIAVDSGEGFRALSFDKTFEMEGLEATIRVYGPAERYLTETSLPLGSSAVPGMVFNPNPNQLSVQIGSVRAVSPALYVVSGLISGRNLASAGLYQNGMLVQQFQVAGGLLSTFAPDVVRQVSFSAQFNPNLGVATVRVFDSSGGLVEQPVMAAGVVPRSTAPYGAYPNPYGAPGYGYGGVPGYGVPNPGYSGYNLNQYGTRPPGANPYQYPNQPPPKTPWWQQLLR